MRRTLLAVVVLALSVVGLAAPADATQRARPREDALFDAVSAKGDLVSATYTANFTDIFVTGFKLRVTTRQGADPSTSAGWFSTNTELREFLDVTSHAGPDLLLVLRALPEQPHTFVAELSDLTGAEPVPVECTTSATFLAPNVYKGQLGADCFATLNPIRVRGRTALLFDPPPIGGSQGTDKSPDSGWDSNLVAPPQG